MLSPLTSPLYERKIHTNRRSSSDSIKGRSDASFILAKSGWDEAKILLHILTTVSLAMLCEVLPIFVIPSIFIGNLSDANNTTSAPTATLLAASGLARTFSNVTSTSVGWGLTSALYTLVPECIGSNNQHLLQIYVQRAAFIIFLALLPLSVIQWFGGYILCHVLKQPMELYPYINDYCHALIPNAWCVSFISILQRCAQSINLNTEFVWVVLVPFLVNIPLNFLCIYYFKWGYIATAIVYDLTIFSSLLLAVFVMVHKGYGYLFEPIQPFFNVVCSKQGLYDYLSLTLPGCVQMSLMWWVAESIIILSGYIYDPSTAVAVTVVVISVHVMFGLITESMGCALTIQVGKCMGCGSIQFAKRSIRISVYINVFVLILMTFIILAFRHSIPKIFSNDDNVTVLASDVFIILMVRELTFNWYTMFASIFRALGYQKIMATVAIVSQYIVMLPIILFILFYYKVDGNTLNGLYVVWSGTTIGYLVSAVVFGCMMYSNCYFNWKQSLDRSTMRIKATVKDYGSINTT